MTSPSARETITRSDVAIATTRMDRRMAEAIADIQSARTDADARMARAFHDVVVAENAALHARISAASIID